MVQIAQHLEGSPINGHIGYINVTGTGTATFYDQENLSGNARTVPPGSYTAGQGALVGMAPIYSMFLTPGITTRLTQFAPGQNPVDGSSWRIIDSTQMQPNQGLISSRNPDGTVTLDQSVTLAPGVTYYLYTQCAQPPGSGSPGLPSPYLDRRRIVSAPGTGNTLTVSLDYLGNSTTVYGSVTPPFGVLGVYNNFKGVSIYGSVKYLIVSGAGNAVIYDGQNLTGNSATVSPGNYSLGFGALSGLSAIESMSLDPGIAIKVCQFTPGTNPIAGSGWRIDTI
jgi:hypothetical protein